MVPPAHFAASSSTDDLHRALAERPLLVVALCAAWCGTCADFQQIFDGLARQHPEATLAWVDIEDDADLAEDIEVDNFPTLAIYHRQRLLHFGVSVPLGPVVGRLIDALNADSPTVDADPAVVDLPHRLASR